MPTPTPTPDPTVLINVSETAPQYSSTIRMSSSYATLLPTYAEEHIHKTPNVDPVYLAKRAMADQRLQYYVGTPEQGLEYKKKLAAEQKRKADLLAARNP